MTAKKTSLLKKGVLKQCTSDRSLLLNSENIDRNALEKYAREAATYATNHFSKPLPNVSFAKMKGKNDVTIFDFTNLYSSKNACRIRECGGHRLLLACVGDSLLEPFWPEGTGIGRGFLGVLDTAWMLKRLAEHPTKVQDVIREREKLYAKLKESTDGSLKDNFKKFTIDPQSRYKSTAFPFNDKNIGSLYEQNNSL